MKIQTYNDAKVELIRVTPNPAELVKNAINLTMKKQHQTGQGCSKSLLKFLVDAGHTSVIEHVSMTFALTGVSRSFLAQVTRHRIGSFTSASQHYADYRDMPMIVHPDHVSNPMLRGTLKYALEAYKILVDEEGFKPEEARQVLPNAAAVNLLWSVNARSLINFFTQRLCNRNVEEMVTVARKVHHEMQHYWMGFADLCGPACYTTGRCNQGKMTCGKPWKHLENDDND